MDIICEKIIKAWDKVVMLKRGFTLLLLKYRRTALIQSQFECWVLSWVTPGLDFRHYPESTELQRTQQKGWGIYWDRSSSIATKSSFWLLGAPMTAAKSLQIQSFLVISFMLSFLAFHPHHLHIRTNCVYIFKNKSGVIL